MSRASRSQQFIFALAINSFQLEILPVQISGLGHYTSSSRRMYHTVVIGSVPIPVKHPPLQ